MSRLLNLLAAGRMSFVIGGQYGSEGKGAAAAYLAAELAEKRGRTFDIITTNAGAQAGHTSVYRGNTRVTNLLPTAALIALDNDLYPRIYLNAGAVFNPKMLMDEISTFIPEKHRHLVQIHPNAAIITKDCVEFERYEGSPQTRISSTCKGVGQALARKVLRGGPIARDVRSLTPYCRPLDLNQALWAGESVLAEVPQGLDLSLDGQFYPYCTSRNSTIEGAMNDAGVHPVFCGGSLLVMRTFPIRVGNLGEHSSGGCYPDQDETSWERLGVPVELTTVTKRPRRVFTFSFEQAEHALVKVRPEIFLLTFCDYLPDRAAVYQLISKLKEEAKLVGVAPPHFLAAFGPATTDIENMSL
jgi:adenylosuccinate synthase